MEQLKALARTCMFAGLKESDLLQRWSYRKGRTFADVKRAVEKGRRRGAGKLEHEEMEIAFALDRVIKPIRTGDRNGRKSRSLQKSAV